MKVSISKLYRTHREKERERERERQTDRQTDRQTQKEREGGGGGREGGWKYFKNPLRFLNLLRRAVSTPNY